MKIPQWRRDGYDSDQERGIYRRRKQFTPREELNGMPLPETRKTEQPEGTETDVERALREPAGH